MTTTTVANLHGQARVDLAVEEAFTFFTESIGRWWPAEYHIGSSPMPGAERAARELVDVAPLRESGPLGESGITRRN